ncbi:putative cs domain-containing protein [Lasiodiplodia theobromae]|uniref:Protein wos2 n=2 Tax=Lasiodiplodia TaxID=66739 RepID=A0A5N5DJ47_9PEZI|nr:HSP90 associated co-chaperone [Lasiodiplodia theobromae]KAB2577351.1 Protein wos2 [Lasiodiplodia theobromae]KAF4540416.1 HSP90 associated co-chaperone [Lasiodiplodia theobromae]KAF9640386.1 putative cs domain-containing protein [Lasiodiplodia theobromae]KAK0659889.1 Protein wos2 [Lasiodiplodia hormozganensis]
MSQSLTPEVLWAQRSSATDPERNHVFLTISAPDVPKEKMTLDVQPTKVAFTGHSELKNVDYKVELELFAEIVPNESKINHTGKNIEMVLRKKELKEEFWPRLLKESKKLHFLKTDFDKWVDEDEQDEAADDDYLANMGGMPGMGGGDGGFGGIDFSKLGGGAGGMPDLGALGGAAGDAEEGSDDDDDMPELEGEDKSAAGAAKASS